MQRFVLGTVLIGWMASSASSSSTRAAEPGPDAPNLLRAEFDMVGAHTVDGAANGIAVVGGHAYVATPSYDPNSAPYGILRILDIRNPERPIRYGDPMLTGFKPLLRAAGTRVYIGEGGNLRIYDASTPGNLSLLGGYSWPGDGEFPKPDTLFWMEVTGDRAWVKLWVEGLNVLDIGDPARPRKLARADFGRESYRFHVSGSRFYLFADAQQAGYSVLDVSDPTQPEMLGNSPASLGAIRALQVAGTTAYTVGSAGFQVLDISDPLQPKVVGRCEVTEGHESLEVIGERVYLAGTHGVEAVAVGSPARPYSLGSDFRAGAISQFAVEGDRLYLAGQRGVFILSIRVGSPQQFDWRSPASPVLALNRPYALQAGVESGLPVRFRVESGPAAVVAGELWVTNLGPVTVVAEQPGDATRLPVRET
ncbi:MAG: hypothetical protein KIT22_13145, partial [Verrucomicrobiae bacterium]|nr:hypothetical protein [Verrucomicrobiae bacterium]